MLTVGFPIQSLKQTHVSQIRLKSAITLCYLCVKTKVSYQSVSKLLNYIIYLSNASTIGTISRKLDTLVSSRNWEIMQIDSITFGVQENGIMDAFASALGDGRC